MINGSFLLVVALTGTVFLAMPALSASPTGSPADAPVLKAPPAAAMKEAKTFRPFRYGRDCKGGAHTNGAWSGGALPTLAVAAYAGDETADEALLKQLRYVMQGKNSPSANGGYPAQHERMLTGSAVVVKNTPRVWAKLTDNEKHKLDLIMKACLVASAYTSADSNYAGKKRPTAIDGGKNFHRDWNPNFREGIIGMLAVGPAYFGPAEAQKILDTYDHDAFVAELKAAGLSNTVGTFHWKADHPDSQAPTGEQIERVVHGFGYRGQDLSDPMKIYIDLTKNTYSGTVAAGLNDGKGIGGAARIAKGAEKLPNLGKKGMLKEFASHDAEGQRSSIGYSYDGFRPNLVNQIALIVAGQWKPGPDADECIALIDVGTTDLFYKLDNGYLNYSHARGSKKPTTIADPRHDYRITRSLWFDVVRPYHDRAK